MTARTADGTNQFLDFNYYPNRQTGDSTAQSFLSILSYERVSMPVFNEGGNFMSNTDGTCMMTTRVTDVNKTKALLKT